MAYTKTGKSQRTKKQQRELNQAFALNTHTPLARTCNKDHLCCVCALSSRISLTVISDKCQQLSEALWVEAVSAAAAVLGRLGRCRCCSVGLFFVAVMVHTFTPCFSGDVCRTCSPESRTLAFKDHLIWNLLGANTEILR